MLNHGLRLRKRLAFTLAELMVVCGIIAILVSLLLPAVQGIRESARNAHCRNNLRQQGLAVMHFEGIHQQFPSGGWGFQWVGDPNKSYVNNAQPGSWFFTILPYLERQDIHDLANGQSGAAKRAAIGLIMQQPAGAYSCPSRRGAELLPYLGQHPLRNASKPVVAFKGDFAVNGGDQPYRVLGGPTDEVQAIHRYSWASASEANGIAFAGSSIGAQHIRDGMSNTYMIGEKFVRKWRTTDPAHRDHGDDQSAYIGDDFDVRRWTDNLPLLDNDGSNWGSFGSSHPWGWNVLMADGSVRKSSYEIELIVHSSLGNRSDGSLNNASP